MTPKGADVCGCGHPLESHWGWEPNPCGEGDCRCRAFREPAPAKGERRCDGCGSDDASFNLYYCESCIDSDIKGAHAYISTACQHGLHDRCRQVCKFCDAKCRCAHHGSAPAEGAKGDAEMIEDAETTLREAAERRKAIARKWGVPAAAEDAREKGEDVLPDSELARIEAQHPPCDLTIRAFCSNGYNHDPNAGDVSHCRCGYEPWPCDTIKLVAALRSARARLGDCCYTNDPCPRAEALAKELQRLRDKYE